jgi:peroxiredoxin Q/BCP
MLREGDPAPKFELDNDRGGKTKLADFRGKRVVVYFYPRDNTPGCTIEAIDFTRAKPKFDALGVPVLGISRDSVKSHCGFRDKHALGIELLSDPDLGVHKAYGAFGEKTMYGKKVEGTIRSTFVIGANGKIERVFSSVKVAGHADAVLGALGAGGAGRAAMAASAAKKSASPKKPAAKRAPEAKAASAKEPAAKKRAAKKPAKAAPVKKSPKKPAKKR